MKRSARGMHPAGAKKQKCLEVGVDKAKKKPIEWVADLCCAAGYQRNTSKAESFTWASAFDGTNAPGFAMELLQMTAARHAYGAEQAFGPAFFSLKNFSADTAFHLFQDVASAVAGKGFCLQHGAACVINHGSQLDFLIQGFSCKSNSAQSSKRWVADPLDASSDSMKTFDSALALLKAAQPTYFALENVLGCRLPRSKKAKEDEVEISPKDYYESRFKEELHGYTVECIELSSSPLPENRPRLWWLGSRSKSFAAQEWKQKVETLEKVALGLPRHHLAPIFESRRRIASASAEPLEADLGYQAEAAYTQAFAQGMEKAIRAKRLPKDVCPPPRDQRPSSRMPALKMQSPWCQGTADVYHLILQEKVASYGGNVPLGDLTLVADVSQSCNRGHVSVCGTWGTLTTSSHLFDFHSETFLEGADHMAILGWGDKPCLDALRRKEIVEMAGNAMSLGHVVKVLLPLFSFLGYYQVVENPKKLAPVIKSSASGAVAGSTKPLLWITGDGILSPSGLSSKVWSDKASFHHHALVFDEEEYYKVGRVSMRNVFPKVILMNDWAEEMGSPVLVAGLCENDDMMGRILAACHEKRGVRAMCLASRQPPQFDKAVQTWDYFTEKIHSQGGSYYITLFVNKQQSLSPQAIGKMLQNTWGLGIVGRKKGCGPLQFCSLIDGPTLTENHVDFQKQVRARKGAEALKAMANHGDFHTRLFVDASTKRMEVLFELGQLKATSIIVAKDPEQAQCSILSPAACLAHMGYEPVVNMALLTPSSQGSMLKASLPGQVACLMLRALQLAVA